MVIFTTANEKRQALAEKYKTILGRNNYSQTKRAYCYKKASDGRYYSDCSSSICYTYYECGYSFGILNTVGMYQSSKLVDVPATIKNGIIQNPTVLRVGDMLLFAGTDSSRASAGYVGHVEMVYSINSNGTVTLCGHGSGHPRTIEMNAYCRTRYGSKTGTKVGNKGLIRVRRFIQDDDQQPITPEQKGDTEDMKAVITGNSVNVRKGPGTQYDAVDIAKSGEEYEIVEMNGFVPIKFKNEIRWVSEKYIRKKG